jgi:hypothetical protein
MNWIQVLSSNIFNVDMHPIDLATILISMFLICVMNWTKYAKAYAEILVE